MSKTRVELNSKGVRTEILQADFMLDFITKEANKMAGGDDHVKSFISFDRAKAFINPNTRRNHN